MDILRLLFLALMAFVFFALFFGHGSLKLRLGRKEKPILRFRMGDFEDEEKEEGSN